MCSLLPLNLERGRTDDLFMGGDWGMMFENGEAVELRSKAYQVT